MMTSGVIGLPGTEPTMLFAGFNVYQGHLTLVGIFALGVVGDVLGASIAYAIGYFGSRELFERRGRRLHLSAQRIDRTGRWFERYGAPVILVSRLIPFARLAFPYAAGVGRMPYSVPATRRARLDRLGHRAGPPGTRGRLELAKLEAQPRVRRLRRRRRGARRHRLLLIVRMARGGGGGPTPDVAS